MVEGHSRLQTILLVAKAIVVRKSIAARREGSIPSFPTFTNKTIIKLIIEYL